MAVADVLVARHQGGKGQRVAAAEWKVLNEIVLDGGGHLAGRGFEQWGCSADFDSVRH